MIKGMTGFGRRVLNSKGIRGAVEIRSLNHRYLDLTFSLPPGFSLAEQRIREIIQKCVERGRISISVKSSYKPIKNISLDYCSANEYLAFSKKLKKELSLAGELGVSDLLKLPGVVEYTETQISFDDAWPTIEKSFQSALIEWDSMRRREGKSLCLDIVLKLKEMRKQINIVQKRILFIFKTLRQKLSNEEFSAESKKIDINEELSRLGHFISETLRIVKSGTSVGKKLDFIVQEMQRETNTIGSKVQDSVISNAVIELKCQIEKIREQSQNIE